MAARSRIGRMFIPPTLIPRNSATCTGGCADRSWRGVGFSRAGMSHGTQRLDAMKNRQAAKPGGAELLQRAVRCAAAASWRSGNAGSDGLLVHLDASRLDGGELRQANAQHALGVLGGGAPGIHELGQTPQRNLAVEVANAILVAQEPQAG